MCSIGKGVFDGPSDAASVQAIAAWHTNAVRVPLNEDCWLGINGVNPAYSGVPYQQAIANYVSLLNQNGLVAILDLAGSAPGTTLATDQQQPMPDQDHSVAFWSQVATIYKSNGAVIFDLFNEAFPDSNQDTTAAWVCLRDGSPCPGVSYVAAGMQTLVNTVRGVGASNVLLVRGVTFSGHLSQWLQYKPVDPLNNIAASWHSYNFSQCRDQTCWDSEVAPLSQRVPIIVGELGEDDCASVYTDRLIAWMDAHALSYLAWGWNTWGCPNVPYGRTTLISDYNGSAVGTGISYHDHLAALAGVATNTPTTTSTATSPATPTSTPVATTAVATATPGSTVSATPIRPTSTATAAPTSSPTGGVTVTDDLNDWSKVWSHSPNLTFNTNTANFAGDPSHVSRTRATAERIIWKLPGLSAFRALTYFWPGEPVSPFSLLTSADGLRWSPARPTITAGPQAGWTPYTYSLSPPSGTAYVKVVWNNLSGQVWSPQIGQVVLSTR